jgi:hypothetical protein
MHTPTRYFSFKLPPPNAAGDFSVEFTKTDATPDSYTVRVRRSRTFLGDFSHYGEPTQKDAELYAYLGVNFKPTGPIPDFSGVSGGKRIGRSRPPGRTLV